MLSFLGFTLLFLAVFTLTFLLFQWTTRTGRVDERLAKEDEDQENQMVFGPMTPALAGQSPVLSEANRHALGQELRQAGFYQRTALVEYRAIRAVLVLAPIFVALALAVLLERPQSTTVLIMGAIVAALGYSLPRLYLSYLGAKRLNSIRRGLPVAIDLITLGLTAGQNIISALQRVSVEIRHAYPELAYELQIVIRQATLNTLPHALEQFADRVEVQEVRNLAVLISQAERLGTDMSTALLEFSASYRTTLKHQAEAQANRASFWLLFPSILCLWIPAGIILLGPIFFEFRHQRERVREIMRLDSTQLNPLSAPPPPANGSGTGGSPGG